MYCGLSTKLLVVTFFFLLILSPKLNSQPLDVSPSSDLLGMIESLSEQLSDWNPGAPCEQCAVTVSRSILDESLKLTESVPSGRIAGKDFILDLKVFFPLGNGVTLEDLYREYKSKTKNEFIKVIAKRIADRFTTERSATVIAQTAYTLFSERLRKQNFHGSAPHCKGSFDSVWDPREGIVIVNVAGECALKDRAESNAYLQSWKLRVKGETIPKESGDDLVWETRMETPVIESHCNGNADESTCVGE